MSARSMASSPAAAPPASAAGRRRGDEGESAALDVGHGDGVVGEGEGGALARLEGDEGGDGVGGGAGGLEGGDGGGSAEAEEAPSAAAVDDADRGSERLDLGVDVAVVEDAVVVEGGAGLLLEALEVALDGVGHERVQVEGVQVHASAREDRARGGEDGDETTARRAREHDARRARARATRGREEMRATVDMATAGDARARGSDARRAVVGTRRGVRRDGTLRPESVVLRRLRRSSSS